MTTFKNYLTEEHTHIIGTIRSVASAPLLSLIESSVIDFSSFFFVSSFLIYWLRLHTFNHPRSVSGFIEKENIFYWKQIRLKISKPKMRKKINEWKTKENTSEAPKLQLRRFQRTHAHRGGNEWNEECEQQTRIDSARSISIYRSLQDHGRKIALEIAIILFIPNWIRFSFLSLSFLYFLILWPTLSSGSLSPPAHKHTFSHSTSSATI